MSNAYNFKLLGEKLQKEGLGVLMGGVEETAKVTYKVVKEWLKESAIVSENKIDDVVMPFIDQADAIVNPLIDKIDGTVDAAKEAHVETQGEFVARTEAKPEEVK